MNTHMNGRMMGGAIFCALFGAVAMPAQVGIYGIGDLAGGDSYSEVRSAIITSDGTIVAVGGGISQSWNTVANGGGIATDTAVIWTKGSGAGVLQALPPVVAPNIDNIGRVVTAGDVTESSTGNLNIAARSYYNASVGFSTAHPNAKQEMLYSYTVAGGNATYGTSIALTPNVSQFGQNAANAISRDGTVVYGFAQVPGGMVSTRWTAGTGLVSLGQIGTGPSASVSNNPSGRAISADGSVVVGTATLADTVTTQAFLFNSGTSSFATLGTLAGGVNSQALAVSADGTRVFGTSESTAHPNGEAFFWTSGGGFTAAGTPNDAWIPNVLGGVTADGTAAVVAFDTGTGRASYLFNSHGMYDLATVFAAGGIDLSGWSDLAVQGISSDGQLIFGSGVFAGNTQGFVAEVPLGLAAAIPEPSAFAALGGVAALGVVLRARRRQMLLRN